MAGHRKFSDLTKDWSDQRRAGVKRLVREAHTQMLLAELRTLAGMTQSELAEAMDVSQSQVSQLEHQDDMQISTLQRIVAALGGELELTVNLPTGRIMVTQFAKPDAA